jgi:(p)ppGpp synthase/HD superfamily hydrolase
MREYAITYQQLVRQASLQGFSDSDLARLKTGYSLAMRLTDGLYRKQMVPFICHLVRTSSIVMHETRETTPILASMLHAVFFLHVFADSTYRGPRSADRRFLRRELGEEVDRLIEDYSQFGFGETEAAFWASTTNELDARMRRLLMMRLADELEDHLDAAEAFVPLGKFRPGDTEYGKSYIALAHRLGMQMLASDFQEALEMNHAVRLPREVLSTHSSSFELRNRLWTANTVERLGGWLRRRMKHKP